MAHSILDPPRSLSDDALLARLHALLRESRRSEATLVAHIGELDARRLYRREASTSMFAYCTDVLHLSEAEAYLRITVARAARDLPVLLDMLAEGRLHLSGIARLLRVLTPANAADVLERAAFRSKREIEELVAELAPREDAPTSIRKLPESPPPSTGTPGPAPAAPTAPQMTSDAPAPVLALTSPRGASIEPIAPARYKVQFTASAAFRAKLERLQALMRSAQPDFDLARVLEDAVSEKLARLEARRFGKSKAPRSDVPEVDSDPNARYIPAPVRRAVHERDEGRCRFVSAAGSRCRETADLEYHHVRPWAWGGERTVGNLRLMCPPHNALLAEGDYGLARIARYRRARVAQPASGRPIDATVGGLGAPVSRPPP